MGEEETVYEDEIQAETKRDNQNVERSHCRTLYQEGNAGGETTASPPPARRWLQVALHRPTETLRTPDPNISKFRAAL